MTHVTVLHTRDRAEADTEAFVAPLEDGAGRLVRRRPAVAAGRRLHGHADPARDRGRPGPRRGGRRLVGRGDHPGLVPGPRCPRGQPDHDGQGLRGGLRLPSGRGHRPASARPGTARTTWSTSSRRSRDCWASGSTSRRRSSSRAIASWSSARASSASTTARTTTASGTTSSPRATSSTCETRRRVSGDFGLKLEAPAADRGARQPRSGRQDGGRRVHPAHADSSWEMARKIWDWAEVGYQEKRSSALLADALEAGGFRVERGVAGIPDGVHRHDRLGQAGDRDPGRVRRAAGPLAAGRAGASSSAGRHGRPRLRPPPLRRGLGRGLPGPGRADQGRDAQGDASILRLPGRGGRQRQGVHGPRPPLRRLRRRAALAPVERERRPATSRARRGSPPSSGSTAPARTPPRPPKRADRRSTPSS